MSRVIECCGKGVTEPLCDPLTLLRFFNSRDNVVEDAVGMYRETVAWRESFGIARIMKGESCKRTELCCGRDCWKCFRLVYYYFA